MVIINILSFLIYYNYPGLQLLIIFGFSYMSQAKIKIDQQNLLNLLTDRGIILNQKQKLIQALIDYEQINSLIIILIQLLKKPQKLHLVIDVLLKLPKMLYVVEKRLLKIVQGVNVIIEIQQNSKHNFNFFEQIFSAFAQLLTNFSKQCQCSMLQFFCRVIHKNSIGKKAIQNNSKLIFKSINLLAAQEKYNTESNNLEFIINQQIINSYYANQSENKIKSSFQKLHFKHFNNISSKGNMQCCYGCIESISLNRPLPFSTQVFSILSLNSNNGEIEQQMRRKVVGILNSGGGYLFITHNINDGMRGFSAIDEQKYREYQNWINFVLYDLIYPQNYSKIIEHLPLMNNSNQFSYQFISRIILKPKQQCLYFVKNVIKGGLDKYVCKFLSQNNSQFPYQDSFDLAQSAQFYNIIIKFWKNGRKLKKIKQKSKIVNSRCLFKDNFKNELINNLNIKSDIDNEIKSTYQFQSILILSSKSHEKFMKNIKQEFLRKKIVYKQIIPYKSYYTQSSKVIYYICHQNNFATLYNIIQEVTNKKQLAFISCTKYIKVSEKFQRLLPFIQQFHKKFKDYKLEIKVEKSSYISQGMNNTYYLIFRNIEESLFCFVYLDCKRIRVQYARRSQIQPLKTISY